jgi:surface protein
MAIHITSNTKSATLTPTSKDELTSIIMEEIKRQGPDADLNFIDTSLITDMSFLFVWVGIRNIKIDEWDVSNVTNMDKMFSGCKEFSCDLSKWDVSNVKYHRFMFDNCHIDDAYKPKFK